MATPKKNVGAELRPRIRVISNGEVILGPGKAELLQHVADTGSLNQAAKRMKMSYMTAWLMVGILNRSYQKPILKLDRGGAKGGGAVLTETGQRVLALYQQMQAASLAATQPHWTEMQKLLQRPTRSNE